jgi:hypothetical protein
MAATDARPAGRGHARGRSARARLFRVWAWMLSVLLGVLFTSVTALTVTLWATDPGYTETDPVLDLAFFALGGILVTGGIASQIRRPRPAGVQQSLLALGALSLAGLLGGRIEPFVGGVVLLVALTPLAVLHPDRRRLLHTAAGPSWPLLGLTLLAVPPGLVYAVARLGDARGAGASCFLGQCAGGDRLAEAGALAIAVLAVALLASLRIEGWQVPAWCTGLAAMVPGVASLAFPQATGALALAGAVGAVAWGAAFIVVARAQARDRRPRTRRLVTSAATPDP